MDGGRWRGINFKSLSRNRMHGLMSLYYEVRLVRTDESSRGKEGEEGVCERREGRARRKVGNNYR